jgi:hypothetical protein
MCHIFLFLSWVKRVVARVTLFLVPSVLLIVVVTVLLSASLSTPWLLLRGFVSVGVFTEQAVCQIQKKTVFYVYMEKNAEIWGN